MADFVQISQYAYIGAAADTKPASGVPVGTRCYEHDTKKWFITYNAGANWVEMQDLDALVLGAGSAIVGKVGIDQTTPGTTNAVVEASAAAIKAAVEVIDNFISGARGLVTEDSGVAIKTAVEAINTALQNAGITQAQLANMVTALQLIDNGISGNEMQVDVVAALPVGANIVGKVGIDQTTPGTTDRVTANVANVGGTAQTARDWSTDLQVLTDLKKGALNADDLTAETGNVLKVIAHLVAFDGTGFDRLRIVDLDDTITTQPALLNLSGVMAQFAANDWRQIIGKRPNTDALSISSDCLCVNAIDHQYDAAADTWVRRRTNSNATLLASAARAVDASSSDQTNYNHSGIIVFVNISAVAGDDTVKILVEGKDPISGTYYTIFTGAELGTTGLRVYEIHPSVAAAAGGVTGVANRLLPVTWRVTLDYTQVTGVADTITASVAACLIP